jgi:hypothetical protein
MVLNKADLRASLMHDLSTAVPQAPTREIEAAAAVALASIPSNATLSLAEANAVITKAVRGLRAAPIYFGTKSNTVAVETTKATDGANRRTFRITRVS